MDLNLLLYSAPGLLAAIVLHEWAHARVATNLGDPTPRLTGRLTLNPLSHLDPIGLLMLIAFNFGWAKPVQINPQHLRRGVQDMIWVGLAGPGMNVLVAFSADVLLKTGGWFTTPAVATVLQLTRLYNVYFAIFNLLPIPPLDGSRILEHVLPRRYMRTYTAVQQYGWLILLLFLVSGLAGAVLVPLAQGLLSLLSIPSALLAQLLSFAMF